MKTKRIFYALLILGAQIHAQQGVFGTANWWIGGYDVHVSGMARVSGPDADVFVAHSPVVFTNHITFQMVDLTLTPPFGMGTGWRTYWQLYWGTQSCGGTPTLLNNTSGITVLAIDNVTSPLPAGMPAGDYALVGSCKEGIWYGCQNRWTYGGNFPGSRFYPFPTVLSNPPAQPHIVQEAGTHNYYICGEYDGKMVVMKINQAGNQIWSALYDMSIGLFTGKMVPAGIKEDPFMPNALVIAGTALNQNSNEDGFLIRIDANTGALMTTNFYDNGTLGNNGFRSFDISMGAGPQGYVLAGYSEIPGGSPRPWFGKVDVGGNPVLSKVLAATSDPNSSTLLSVRERNNPYAGRFEYYVLFNSGLGTLVGKLDQNGDPINMAFPWEQSEFFYPVSFGKTMRTLGLNIDNGIATANGTGFSTYGTQSNGTSALDFIVTRAFFNGVTGCATFANLNPPLPEPLVIGNSPVMPGTPLGQCSNFAISYWGNTAGMGGCGGNLSAGSNLRTTGMEEQTAKIRSAEVTMGPNPTNEKCAVEFYTQNATQVELEVTDVLGRTVLHQQLQHLQPFNSQQAEVDFKTMGVPEGIYLVTLRNSEFTATEKIVFSH